MKHMPIYPSGSINGLQSLVSIEGKVKLPEITGDRIMMMPFDLKNLDTVPPKYRKLVKDMLNLNPKDIKNSSDNTIAYLTIDERKVEAGEIQRNPGLHIDGMYNGEMCGGWGGGGGGAWGSNGMLITSNISQSNIFYRGDFEGNAIKDGDCEHLRAEIIGKEIVSPEAGEVIWANGQAVHEALPIEETQYRQFIRISLPSKGPWFADYTPSPYGVQPAGEILAPRIAEQEKIYGKVQ